MNCITQNWNMHEAAFFPKHRKGVLKYVLWVIRDIGLFLGCLLYPQKMG